MAAGHLRRHSDGHLTKNSTGHLLNADCCCDVNDSCCYPGVHGATTIRVVLHNIVLQTACQINLADGSSGLMTGGAAVAGGLLNGTFDCDFVGGTPACYWEYHDAAVSVSGDDYTDGVCAVFGAAKDHFTIQVARISTTQWQVKMFMGTGGAATVGWTLGYWLITGKCCEEKDGEANFADAYGYHAGFFGVSPFDQFGEFVMGNGGTIDLIPLC